MHPYIHLIRWGPLQILPLLSLSRGIYIGVTGRGSNVPAVRHVDAPPSVRRILTELRRTLSELRRPHPVWATPHPVWTTLQPILVTPHYRSDAQCFGTDSGLDPDLIRSVDPDPGSKCGSGSTTAKMTHKKGWEISCFELLDFSFEGWKLLL